MKQYKIGEIASIMNISKEMVRYYEKCGIIKPQRLENNNYRSYSVLDLFLLIEATVLAQFNVNMKDIQQIRKENFTFNLAECYRKYLKQTEEEIGYLSLKRKRAVELLEDMEIAIYNIGHFWVKKIPKHYAYPFMTAHNDEYDDILADRENRYILSNHKYLPFLNPSVEFQENGEKWTLDMDIQYVKSLHMPHIENEMYIPEQYYFCTVIDMGSIGNFNRNVLSDILEKFKKEQYRIIGNPIGVLLGRGIEQGVFKRLLEIRIPIQTMK